MKKHTAAFFKNSLEIDTKMCGCASQTLERMLRYVAAYLTACLSANHPKYVSLDECLLT